MPSALKEKFVDTLTEELKKSDHVIVSDFQGMTAEQLNDLRAKLRDLGAKYKVVKNRLAKISIKNVGWDIEDQLKGPSALVFQGEDVASITKVLYEFSKANKAPKIKGGFMFGKKADQKDVTSVAQLPSREVLLATLASRLNGPLQSLLATLNEPLRALHASLSAVAKNKESAPAS